MRKNVYSLKCSCGSVEFELVGKPKVRGHCHCEDCRDLLNTPYHSVTAWTNEQLNLSKGQALLKNYKHPSLEMERVFCSKCGDTIFNTNAMNWRVVSQHLIRKCLGELPNELQAKSHFFYARRIVDIDDGLPKND